MNIEKMGVYLIDFKQNVGAEFSGKHYAVVITEQVNNTFLVVPITSKKSGKRYRHGITIDNEKYLSNPKYNRAFLLVRKLREVDRKRVLGTKRYSLDTDDEQRLLDKIDEILDI